MNYKVVKKLHELYEEDFQAKMKRLGFKCFNRVYYRNGTQVWEYRIGTVVVGEKIEVVGDFSRRGEMHYFA